MKPWRRENIRYLLYLADGARIETFEHTLDAMVYAQSQANARDRSVFMCPDLAPFFEMEFKPVYTFKT